MAAPAKIRAMKVGAGDRKKMMMLGGLVLAAIILFWYNSRDEGEGGASSATANRPAGSALPGEPAASTAAGPARTRTVRRTRDARATSDHGSLRVKAIDPVKGDVDPTLRLTLLARLQSLQPTGGKRNLFEMGPPPVAAMPAAVKGPTIIPKAMVAPLQGTPGSQTPLPPLRTKFYGFVRSNGTSPVKRAFFLDGDNILVAGEGDVLERHYKIVQLRPNGATVEDIATRRQQTMPIVPEAQANE